MRLAVAITLLALSTGTAAAGGRYGSIISPQDDAYCDKRGETLGASARLQCDLAARRHELTDDHILIGPPPYDPYYR